MEQNLNISGKIIWMRQYSAIIQATNGMKVPGEKLGLDADLRELHLQMEVLKVA